MCIRDSSNPVQGLLLLFSFICYHKSWDRVIKLEDNTSFKAKWQWRIILHLRKRSCWLCKPETKSRVCITVSNSPNPSLVYIRLCKHRKKVFYYFYKITSFETTTREKMTKIRFNSKQQHWLDDGISQLTNQNLYFEIYNSCIFTSHNHTLMYTHLSVNQSARTILVIL